MKKAIKADEVQVAGQGVATEDLSDAIEASVDKEPSEEVRTVWVFGDNYRCNWWVRDNTPGVAYLNTGKIIRSKFLRATKTGENLVIEDMSIRRP